MLRLQKTVPMTSIPAFFPWAIAVIGIIVLSIYRANKYITFATGFTFDDYIKRNGRKVKQETLERALRRYHRITTSIVAIPQKITAGYEPVMNKIVIKKELIESTNINWLYMTSHELGHHLNRRSIEYHLICTVGNKRFLPLAALCAIIFGIDSIAILYIIEAIVLILAIMTLFEETTASRNAYHVLDKTFTLSSKMKTEIFWKLFSAWWTYLGFYLVVAAIFFAVYHW